MAKFNEWQLMVWNALIDADGEIVNFNEILKENDTQVPGYQVQDFFEGLKEEGYVKGKNTGNARVTFKGKEFNTQVIGDLLSGTNPPKSNRGQVKQVLVNHTPLVEIDIEKAIKERQLVITDFFIEQTEVSLHVSTEPMRGIKFNVELNEKGYEVRYNNPQNTNEELFSSDVFEKVQGLFKNWLDLIKEEYASNSQKNYENLEKDAELLHDNPSEVDDLGRDVLMEIVSTKINELWVSFEKKEANHNYTVLIDGEWGSGKTSMLGFLEGHLKTKNWDIVKYNAWENQRLDDQWWVFINKISKTLSSKNNHRWWAFKMKNYKTIIIAVALIVVISLGLIFFPGEENGFKTIGGMIGLIGSIWITIGSVTKNFLNGRVTSSELLKNNTSDPYKPIKDRFNKVTNSKNVAIFIDDLDRCDTEATVGLLEGIQTLFKETKVLYVIAADGNWISKCFTHQYEKFSTLGKDGHSIGNKFLQKSFQLVLEVPKMSLEDHQKMWYKFLGYQDETNNRNQPQKNTEETKEQVEEKIEEATNISGLKESVKGADFEGRKKAAEKVEQMVEEQKSHLLMEYLDYMPKNLRQMKRLINQYVIKYQSLFIAGTESEISDDDLVRYIIFAMKYPDYDSEIKKGQKTLEKIKEGNPKLNELLGENITTELIRNYL